MEGEPLCEAVLQGVPVAATPEAVGEEVLLSEAVGEWLERAVRRVKELVKGLAVRVAEAVALVLGVGSATVHVAVGGSEARALREGCEAEKEGEGWALPVGAAEALTGVVGEWARLPEPLLEGRRVVMAESVPPVEGDALSVATDAVRAAVRDLLGLTLGVGVRVAVEDWLLMAEVEGGGVEEAPTLAVVERVGGEV